MKDGKLKKILYKFKIIPAYSWLLQKVYDNKIKRASSPDRWYFCLLPIKKNKIVFDNFLGRGYGDNPKAITDEIIRQGINLDLVWLVRKKEDIPSQIRQVKYCSKEAMRELATAKMWIFNVRNVKHPQKRRGQIYLHTSHGNHGFKLVEGEAKNLDSNYLEFAKQDGAITDYILSSCPDETEKMQNHFWLNENTTILELGTPKDDILFHDDAKSIVRARLKKLFNIPNDKGVILYMPTFRDNLSMKWYDLNFSEIKNAFRQRFHKDCIVLQRLHPNIPTELKNQINKDKDVIDVSSFPDGTELLFVADYMISDYSGIIISFAMIKKPVFLYTPDFQTFRESRGLRDYYDKIPCKKAYTKAELIQNINEYDELYDLKNWDELFKKMNYYNLGNSTEKVVEWIKKYLYS